MAKPIQAGSLATIIDLADNPPDQPLHTGDLQQPLVLYIARVPGSHGICFSLSDPNSKELMTLDIFLTTMYVHFRVYPSYNARLFESQAMLREQMALETLPNGLVARAFASKKQC